MAELQSGNFVIMISLDFAGTLAQLKEYTRGLRCTLESHHEELDELIGNWGQCNAGEIECFREDDLKSSWPAVHFELV
jgi:hypothetical protein